MYIWSRYRRQYTYLCMYACMHVCVVCMYVCTYVCTYVLTYVCMYVSPSLRVCVCISSDSDWCLFVLQQASWLSPATALRFSHPECVENRTWKDIAANTRNEKSMFTSGSLRKVYTPDHFHVWGCWKQHECLQRVPHVDGDSMCYVYHEKEHTWLPWKLRSEMKNVCRFKSSSRRR